jgi:hypothetical protein
MQSPPGFEKQPGKVINIFVLLVARYRLEVVLRCGGICQRNRCGADMGADATDCWLVGTIVGVKMG